MGYGVWGIRYEFQHGLTKVKYKLMKLLFIFGFMVMGWSVERPAPFPQAEISNGLVKAVLLLPDITSGYYQASRFDWAGVVKTLEYKGHSYFDEWFKDYDPKKHDAITGPVEEFGPMGYEAAKPGDSFIKIGVGAVRRKDDKPYSFSSLYDIVDPGTWKVTASKDQVIFTQELKDVGGYAYVYTKTLRLVKGKPELVLEHTLKNTGTKLLETTVYDHNFFLIDKVRTGPNVRITFPYAINGTGRGIGSFASINGKEIVFSRELKETENMYIADLAGYGNEAKDYDIRIENTRSGAGVRITADQPLHKLVVWACSTTACPEPYIHVSAAPGKEFNWKISYAFYELGR